MYSLIRHVKRVLALINTLVCVGMGDLLVAQNDTMCMLGKGTVTLSLCVRSGDRAPAKINTPCVFVREGEISACTH